MSYGYFCFREIVHLGEFSGNRIGLPSIPSRLRSNVGIAPQPCRAHVTHHIKHSALRHAASARFVQNERRRLCSRRTPRKVARQSEETSASPAPPLSMGQLYISRPEGRRYAVNDSDLVLPAWTRGALDQNLAGGWGMIETRCLVDALFQAKGANTIGRSVCAQNVVRDARSW